MFVFIWQFHQLIRGLWGDSDNSRRKMGRESLKLLGVKIGNGPVIHFAPCPMNKIAVSVSSAIGSAYD
jgi:hypothetical protein